jgi:cell division protease FtsH
MDKKPKTQIPASQPGFHWKWVVWIVISIVVLTLLFRGYGTQKSAAISYSEFKRQVKQDNVSEITFKGQEIDGLFIKSYTVLNEPENPKAGGISYNNFVTVKPSLEDPELMPLLEKNNVTIKAQQPGGSWLGSALILLLPWVLIIAYFAYASRKARGPMQNLGAGLFGVGRSGAKRFEKTSADVTFGDVAGLENAKRDLREIVEYLREPGKFKDLGADIPKGVLLIGPPGVGKTLLARATAGEAGVQFFSISGSQFIELFVGVGAARVRDLFDSAKREAPAIIFIDEIDSVGRTRGTGLGGGHDEREQTLNQILSEMDGFEPHQSVVVMAATNRPDVLDPALIRPGRFDRHIVLELPEKKARLEILKIHTRHVPLVPDLNLENLAARTVGFSGADLKNLVNEAALLAGRKNKKQVDFTDFDEARDKILLGAEREEKIGEEEKKTIAYHEAGHALAARLLPGTDPIQKVTIIPRGRALGATEQVPAADRHNYNRQYLLNRIAVNLAGRAAEKLVFGDLTSGAASDLQAVTELARRMVSQWGMSERLGAIYLRQWEEHPFLGRELGEPKDFSEHTAQLVDEEVQRIVKEMEEKAENLLKENRDKLDLIAGALLEHETLESEDIERILQLGSKD